jgi:hypothetical protein
MRTQVWRANHDNRIQGSGDLQGPIATGNAKHDFRNEKGTMKNLWKIYSEEKPEKPGFYFVVWAKDQHQTYYGHSHFDGKRFTERASFVSPLAWMPIPEFKAS